MNALKGLYTWTLVTLFIFAGCLGAGVINDTEGQSSDDSNSNGDSLTVLITQMTLIVQINHLMTLIVQIM